jgi:hypothetical protein
MTRSGHRKKTSRRCLSDVVASVTEYGIGWAGISRVIGRRYTQGLRELAWVEAQVACSRLRHAASKRAYAGEWGSSAVQGTHLEV